MTESPIEHEGLRVEAIEKMFGSGNVSEIREGDVEVLRGLVEARLVEGAELKPRRWASNYKENRVSMVGLFGEEAIRALEVMSERVCPESKNARDKSTKMRGTRMPKFLQDIVRLTVGEESMGTEKFVTRFQTRLRYHREREAGQHVGEVLNPTPISAEAAVAVFRWFGYW